MTIDYDHLATDPRTPKPAPALSPRLPIGGRYTQGYLHGGNSTGGYYVCIVPQTTEAPPSVPGQSTDKWKWSNGRS